MGEMIRLGDVIEIQRGKTYKSKQIGEKGPVLLGLGTINRHGGFRRDNLRTYGGDSPEELLVYPNEVYASLKDVTQTADVLGAVARVPADGPIGRLTQDTVRLDLKSDAASLDYLYWMLRTPQYRRYCQAHATGTTTMGLSRGAFFDFEFPAPCRFRQNLIELLAALDDKIAANERMAVTGDELGTAILTAYIDRDTRPLHELADIVMGSSPPGSSYNEEGIGLPFYQGIRDFGFRFPSRRVWTTEPSRLAKGKDTIVSVRAPVGNTNLCADEMCIGRGLAALSSKSGRPMTLFHQVRAASAAWAPYKAEGTVFGSINKKQLESISIPAVPQACVDEIEVRLVSIEDRIAAALVESEHLASTRDELLPLLMSGRIRVRDAEKVVEEVT